MAEAGPNCKATVNGALLTNALSLAEAGRLLHVAKTERGQANESFQERTLKETLRDTFRNTFRNIK